MTQKQSKKQYQTRMHNAQAYETTTSHDSLRTVSRGADEDGVGPLPPNEFVVAGITTELVRFASEVCICHGD